MGRTSKNADSITPSTEYPPQPVRCRWLTEADERRAPQAEIIRLLVDEDRGYGGNDIYQRAFLRDVRKFIGPSPAVLVTDAGTVTPSIPALPPTLDGLRTGLTALQQALARLNLGNGTGPREVLLGLDGCVGEQVQLQTVVHLDGKPGIALANATVKVYPTDAECTYLLGWQLCEALGRVPDELAASRRVQTAAGTVLVLVCNDAAIFSARSQARLKNRLKLRIRQHFLTQARAKPRPAYILIATHWQGTNPATGRWSGEAFRQAAAYLSEATGATVVTTLRAPRQELVLAADRFGVQGTRADKVATLLVYDTFEEGQQELPVRRV